MSSSSSLVDAVGPVESALGGPPSMSSSTSVAADGLAGSTPRGPGIDVFFNIGGGRYRIRLQHPQGARHRRLLQPWWWSLPDPPTALPRGPTIDVFFNIGGGRCQSRWQRPLGAPPSMSSSTSVVDAIGPTDIATQGARHRRSSTSVVDAVRVVSSAPRGPTIDFFNHGGGRCWAHRQCP
jgi:hypothetical protein